MKRTIYLIRHGEPDFPEGKRTCLSREDLFLSAFGRMQSVLLGRFFEEKKPLTVFHSGLMRTRQTAAYIAQSVQVEPGFLELDVGTWEGKTFAQIREQEPLLYAARGEDPYHCRMPGGEWPEDCLLRARDALDRVMRRSTGDVVITAHAGVNRLLLCSMMNRPMSQFLSIPQPYGCVNILSWDDGRYEVQQIGECPTPMLDEALCEALLEAYGTPEQVRRHCRAVAARAMEIAKSKNADIGLLRAAALLHDIARTQKQHMDVGAQLLVRLGYPQIGDIIRCHHELSEQEEREISEKTLLYLADKLVIEDQVATLEERFARSKVKVMNEQARAAHARRHEQVRRVYDAFLFGRWERRQ